MSTTGIFVAGSAYADGAAGNECGAGAWVQLEFDYVKALKAGDYVTLRALRAKKKGMQGCAEQDATAPQPQGPTDTTTSVGATGTTDTPVAGETPQLPPTTEIVTPGSVTGSTTAGQTTGDADSISQNPELPGGVGAEITLPPGDMSSVGASGVENSTDISGTPKNPPGGETISPGFGTEASLAAEIAALPSATASTAWEAWGHFVRGETGMITPLVARYGNWVGEGWWGASEMGAKVGAQPPIDALDALAQEHDFAYSLAEEAGRKYGEAEKYRLMALADQNSYRAFQKLPKDPAKWRPPPPDLEVAARFRDRFPITMQGLALSHEKKRRNAPPPTPDQAFDLSLRGTVSGAELQQQAQSRIDIWNRDRGYTLRNSQPQAK